MSICQNFSFYWFFIYFCGYCRGTLAIAIVFISQVKRWGQIFFLSKSFPGLPNEKRTWKLQIYKIKCLSYVNQHITGTFIAAKVWWSSWVRFLSRGFPLENAQKGYPSGKYLYRFIQRKSIHIKTGIFKNNMMYQ